MANEKVTLEVLLETKRSVAQLERFTKQAVAQLGQVEKNTKSASSAFKRFGANLAANLSSAVITKGFALLSRSVSQAGQDFLDLSKAVGEINSILPKNQKLTEDTRKAFIRFSTAFGGTPAKQAKAFYQIVSAGITDVTQATKLLGVANKAAVAGVTDITTAINGLTSVLATYGESGVDATEASDTLFAAVREGKTTFGELSSVLGRVTPIASAAGVAFSDVAGSLAFLTKTGQSTDEAATGLRQAIVSIIKPTVDTQKAAKALGVEFGSAQLKSKGLAGVMEDVRKATGGNIDQITKLFPNVRALGAVTALTGSKFEDFNRILGETANASGATEAAFKKIEKTAAFQFGKLTRTIENLPQLFLTLSDQDFANLFSDLRNTLVALIPLFAKFVSLLGYTGIGILEITKRFEDSASGTKAMRIELAHAERNLKKANKAVQNNIGDTFKWRQEQQILSAKIKELRKQLGGQVNASEAAQKALVGLVDASKKVGDTSPKALEETAAKTDKARIAAAKLKTELANIAARDQKAFDLAASIGSTEALEEKIAEQKEILDQAKADALISEEEFIGQMALIRSNALDTQVKADFNRRVALGEFDKKDKEAQLKAEAAFLAKRAQQEEKGSQNRAVIEKKAEDAQKKLRDYQLKTRLNQASTFFGDISSLMQTGNKELFAIGKAAALAQAVVQGALAVQNAFAVQPFPVGAALATAAAIKAAVQISTISAQNLASGMTEVPRGFPNDTFRANLTSGERVVNVEQNRDLTGFLEEQRQNDGGLVGDKIDGLAEIMSSVLDTLAGQEQTTVVNVGNREIIREIRTGLRAGNELAV